MNHALAAAAVSIASLLLTAGCASSPSRSQSCESSLNELNQEGHLDQDANPDSAHQVSKAQLRDAMGDELIIGFDLSSDLAPQYHSPITGYTMSEIQAELEAMYDLDQEVLGESLSSDSYEGRTEQAIRAIDIAQSNRLKEIVEHIGWPTRDSVGLKATQAAYMVIQHSGHDGDFQNKCLAMMIDLVEQGELPASYVALLTDRIRVFQEQPQVFGTQMAMSLNVHGVMVPTPTVPIEDPENLDARRKLMGMPPHSEFAGAIAIAYQASLVDAGTAFAEVQTDE